MDSTKKKLKIRMKELAVAMEKDRTFGVLEGFVDGGLLEAVEGMGFEKMTEVQARCIPPLLAGRDLLGAAKTGSGKTLAFLLPIVHTITALNFTPRNGVGAIVISPTRELAIQILKTLQTLTKGGGLKVGAVMGGVNRGKEVAMLKDGINVLVATPGRLLDHLKGEGVMVRNLKLLVMDEADRILKEGFEQTLKQIILLLPKKRQTVLLSATMTTSTDDLARLSLKDAVRVDVVEGGCATVGGLEQGYLVCPSEQRLHVLLTYLFKKRYNKVMVFVSSCLAVDYLQELCQRAKLDTLSIHGKQPQSSRTATFSTFTTATHATLLCTDVAARGLHFPMVDFVIQYDPPADVNEYIHRVGRTARGEEKGTAVMFLRQEEAAFVKYLKKAKVPISKFTVMWRKVCNVQPQLETMVGFDYSLKNLAREAFKAHVRAYSSRSCLRDIFDVHSLNLPHVATSFGLSEAPFVDLNIGALKKSNKRKQRELYKQNCIAKKRKVHKALEKTFLCH